MFESTCVCPAAWIEVGDKLLESDEWSSELQAPSSNPKAARVATWRGFLIMSKNYNDGYGFFILTAIPWNWIQK